ncbi:MAG: DUF2270 domain-containing protein [Candidatus Eisenbacteria bacterium]|uniref:DUF2270 domain-containing protein n=1 Tax=Eiseniibacteriota bacterium TaxID=2212470 RepID=A0A937X7Y5_UNCEI|nr:DUF2270 domain-containing protein [Candidatus Eisenbacteria bacterium]
MDAAGGRASRSTAGRFPAEGNAPASGAQALPAGGGGPAAGGAGTPAPSAGVPFAGGDVNAMAHFYRGEMNRLTVWRTRMDVATNWAIVATLGLLSLSFKHPSADAILLVAVSVLWVLLVIEARRYRFYDVWRWRIRILEAHFLAPIVRPDGQSLPQGPWRHDLTADLLYPTFKISMREAMGRRLLRNYLYLFALILIVSLANILGISPRTGSWALLTRDHFRVALQENWLFLTLLAFAYVPLVALTVFAWRRRRVAVELHDPGGRRPYRV